MQKQRVGTLGMEGFISEMFKHIFWRIPDEVCVFFSALCQVVLLAIKSIGEKVIL